MAELVDGPVWDGDGRVPLSPLDRDLTVDTCVVGLGGSGLAAIHELLDMGQRVAGVDSLGVAAGAAGRNGGFLLGGVAAFHHVAVDRIGRERATALYRQTLDEITRMANETPDAIRLTGSLRIASDATEWSDCESQLAAMRRDGLPVEPYDGPEGRGLRFASDAAFNPARRCTALAGRAVARGAMLFAPARADRIGAGEVQVGDHRIRCAQVLVMTDGALPRVMPELAGMVRTARLQMLATAPVPRRVATAPVYYRYGYEYWQQLDDGSVVLGGFRDLGGDGEWTEAAAPSTTVQDMLEAFLRRHLRIEEAVTHRWAASVGYTDGVLPFVGEVRRGVWAAGGYNGTGNVIGAICGRGLARLVASGNAELLANLMAAR